MVRTIVGWYIDAYATIGIYAKKSGVWQKATTESVNVNGSYGSGGARTLTWVIDRTYQLGNNVQAFGATVESMSGYYNTSAAVSQIGSVSWQAQNSTGGVSSATPNGEKSKIVVTPN